MLSLSSKTYNGSLSAYPIVSIGDPFDKEDWEHSKYFSSLGICQVCFSYLLILGLIFILLKLLE